MGRSNERKNRRERINNKKKHNKRKEYSENEYMNQDIELNANDTSHENVLLFCISILPKGNAVNTYSGDKDFSCEGILSVEPGTKYVLHTLEQAEERLDRIIIVASTAALEASKEECWWGRTAVGVYKERINSYLNEAEYQHQYKQLAIDENDDTGLPVQVVEFDDGESLDDLMKVVDLFGADNDKDESIHLYVDTQGGYRNWIVQLDALIGILKTYKKVELKGRYAVDYSHDKSSVNQIINVDEFYEMNDLLKGYQNYKRYGVCDDLLDYFNKSENPSVRTLVKNMKEAMDSLTLCDMKTLNDNIDAVTGAKNILDINAPDSRLNLIFKNIFKDLIQLNDGDNNAEKMLARIRWCKEKGMILQALNIIEAEVPNMLRDLNIITLTYNPDGESIGKISNGNGEEKDDDIYKKRNKDIVNISMLKSGIEQYGEDGMLLREMIFQRMRGIEYIGKLEKNNIINFLKNNENKKLSASSCSINIRISEHKKNSEEKIDIIYKPASYNINLNSDKIVYYNALIFIYLILKDQRNNSDHLNKDNTFRSKDELNDGIEILLDLFEDLRACISN